MKKKFTEAQIVFALRQAEGGTPVAEIIRKIEIPEVTFPAGRLVGKPQACLSLVPGGRVGHEETASQAAKSLFEAGSAARDCGKERVLEHGLHVGRALRWASDPAFNDSGQSYP